MREIGTAVGLASSSTVHGHLARLESKGYIRRDPTKPRAIEVLDPEGLEVVKPGVLNVPLVGKVTAGLPITAIENIEEYFPLPETFGTADDNIFMLEIVGESMIEAGILNGDYVVVKQTNTAQNGEIIVAMTEDDEATVKRFFKERIISDYNPKTPQWSPLLWIMFRFWVKLSAFTAISSSFLSNFSQQKIVEPVTLLIGCRFNDFLLTIIQCRLIFV